MKRLALTHKMTAQSLSYQYVQPCCNGKMAFFGGRSNLMPLTVEDVQPCSYNHHAKARTRVD